LIVTAAILTLARLMELLEYFPLTGIFVWRARSSTFSRIKIGDIAGNITHQGYVCIKIDRRLYFVHRLAWLYMTGAWPENQIDHIDGNPSNNRWHNLRDATNSENQQNLRTPHSDNKCGLLGVSKHKDSKKWIAQIRINGKARHLGYFPTAEIAHAAYLKAKRRLHAFCAI